MRKILCLLSVLLLFTLPPASTATEPEPGFYVLDLAQLQELENPETPTNRQQPVMMPATPSRNPEQQPAAADPRLQRELQEAMRGLLMTLEEIPQNATREREIQTITSMLQEMTLGLQRRIGPPANPRQSFPLQQVQQTRPSTQQQQQSQQAATRQTQQLQPQQPVPTRQTQQPVPPAPNTRNNPLTAERERAYIELARQYFQVFISTPVEPPVTLRSLAEQMSAAVPAVAENGDEDAEEPLDPKEEWTRKREEILENFVECVRKISPAAQISLITELIRSSHTNEELKLLEDLLDEVLTPEASGRAGQIVPAYPPLSR